jgi:hypothetical protein
VPETRSGGETCIKNIIPTMGSGGEIFTIRRDRLLKGSMAEEMAEEVTPIRIGISNIRRLTFVSRSSSLHFNRDEAHPEAIFVEDEDSITGVLAEVAVVHLWAEAVEIKDGVLVEEAVLLLSGETEEKDREILILIMVDMGGVGD